jgi:hypothetical protein
MTELNPCPFCGSTDIDAFVRARCQKCGASTKRVWTGETQTEIAGAIRLWNAGKIEPADRTNASEDPAKADEAQYLATQAKLDAALAARIGSSQHVQDLHEFAAHSPKGADTQPERSEGHPKPSEQTLALIEAAEAERRRAASICVAEARACNRVVVDEMTEAAARLEEGTGHAALSADTQACLHRERRDALMQAARKIVGKTR